jgi:hypothetical protein
MKVIMDIVLVLSSAASAQQIVMVNDANGRAVQGETPLYLLCLMQLACRRVWNLKIGTD